MRTDIDISQKNKPIKIIRRTARILSGILILFALFMFVGYAVEGAQKVEPQPLSATAILGLAIFGIGMLGLALAWKWETAGGLLSLAAFLLVFTLTVIQNTGGRLGIFFFFPLDSVLFLVAAFMEKNKNT
jgi:hypothetical protein